MKKILSFILAAVMLAASAALPTVAAPTGFSDVADDRWSAPSVAYAVERGYMKGVGGGLFDPEGTMTRAMVVTVLWRMSGSPEPTALSGFKDVPESEWYAKPVAWAKKSGIVSGVSAKLFDPDGAITREQMATMLGRYTSFLKFAVEGAADLSLFPDEGSVSDWARDALAWAVGKGLITGSREGKKTLLLPGDSATREQFAAILERFDGKKESFSYVLEYNHPVLLSSYTEKEYPLVEGADFYVSPSGDDSGPGTKDAPFRTFSRAVLAVREIPKTAERGGITVAFMAGEYPSPGFSLTAEDSGAAECPVVYCKYGDGDVKFTGGVRVKRDEFVPIGEEDKKFFKEKNYDRIKKVDIGDRVAVGELSWASEAFGSSYGRLDAARYPNRNVHGEEIYLERIAEGISVGQMRIKHLTNRFKGYHTWDGVEIIGCIGHEYWKTVFPATGFDPETGIISYDVIGPQYGLDEYAIGVYFLKVSEELDWQNEYWIDPDGGTLYVFDPTEEEYVVSTVETIGTLDGCSYVAFRGIDFEGCTGDGIVVKGHDVAFDRCRIIGIGGRAGLRCYGVDFRMQDCEFAYTAGCGMWFESDRPVEDLVPTGPYIDNCLIHDMGQKWKNLQNPGIRVKCAVGARISHCELYNTPCAAITFGYCAEGGRERTIDCVFEYNYIHDVDQDVVDIGCIYTGRSFVNRDNIIRYNVISDIPGAGGRFAIYLDDGLAAQKIYGNIFYDFTDYAVVHSGGQYMDIHDNVCIETKGVDRESFCAIFSSAKYYDFAYDDDDDPATPWNSGNFRILYSTLKMRPMEGGYMEEYYGLWRARWPELYEVIDDYDWENFTDTKSEERGVNNPNCPATPGFCSVYNNYAIGNCSHYIAEPVARFAIRCENNVEVPFSENPLFVNPTLGDYRIRDDAEGIMKIPYEEIGRY